LARVVSGLFLSCISNCMVEKESSLTSAKQHGGARPGAGRPKGSTDKLTAKLLLETCHQVIGKPFEVSLIEGYRQAIDLDDRRNRAVYEKMILDKVSTTLIEAEVTESDDAVAAKAAAFQEALAKLVSLDQSTK
jgi:hypothetical protein